MAIRKNLNPREMDLQPELRDILMRNGMQAHIIPSGKGYQLAVQGHDSPLLTYPLTQKQMLALTDWGTNFANKKAYNVFTSIVGGDFHLPRNFVHARNANGRVAMGLHGYRIGIGEYGRMHPFMPLGRGHLFSPCFLGWTPRQQEGWHLRRVGGQMFYAGAPMVAERMDGRMKPGEMTSGGYGFYYKGNQAQSQRPVAGKDVLEDLKLVVKPIATPPRKAEPAKPYKELVTSPVYFSNEKWQECLSSHGIHVNAEAKTLTIQSAATDVDLVYDLKDEEVASLTSNSLKEVPLEKRLEILNEVIRADFVEKITMDQLNGNKQLSIELHPEVKQELQMPSQEAVQPMNVGPEEQVAPEIQEQLDLKQEEAYVDGRDLNVLNENKGWFREGAHGREVEVQGISVAPTETEGKYRMTAIINGERISHEISQKQYDKFLAVDDYHRMKLFSKVFDEVDLKTRPEAQVGLGTKILAALTAGAVVTAEVAQGLNTHHHCVEIYSDCYTGPRPYFKPGVDTPREIAARNFEAQANQIVTEIRRGY